MKSETNMKKEVEIRCRVTTEEKSFIKQKAVQNNMKLSEYVRLCALNTSIVETTITTEIKCK
jgi:uncharacterized protein (DUF1778 family)